MFSNGDSVCAVVGAPATEISNPGNLKLEVGTIGKVEQILPYHEPCHPKYKGQFFAIVNYTKKIPLGVFKMQFAFDLRDLRKIQI